MHVADTEALELEKLLLLKNDLQELCVLAILLEPLGHARLVSTPVVAEECQDCERSIWVSRHARGSIANGTFSEDIAPFSTTKIFHGSGPKIRKFRQEFDALPRQYTSGYCCHTNSVLLHLVVSKAGDIHLSFSLHKGVHWQWYFFSK